MRTTSSSISSSEPRADPNWRAFATTVVVTATLLLVSVVALAFLLDPYDSGRSPLRLKPGVPLQGPRTAAASRGRDPRFAAAVVGNSHVQILSPERLEAATELPFVQLSVPGSGPQEQLALVDWFLRHRPEGVARALVIGLDELWCTGDPALPQAHPFPFWLLSRSTAEYLRGLVRWSVLEELPRRVTYLASPNAQRARPDGYWDYEPEYARRGHRDAATLAAEPDRQGPLNKVYHGRGFFPAAERLETLFRALAPDLAVVLVHPPIYAPGLSPAGSPAADWEARCKAAFGRVAATRPATAVVDWRVDRPETRDPRSFFDQTHYRQELARLVESDIVRALQAAPGEPRPAAPVPASNKGSR